MNAGNLSSMSFTNLTLPPWCLCLFSFAFHPVINCPESSLWSPSSSTVVTPYKSSVNCVWGLMEISASRRWPTAPTPKGLYLRPWSQTHKQRAIMVLPGYLPSPCWNPYWICTQHTTCQWSLTSICCHSMWFTRNPWNKSPKRCLLTTGGKIPIEVHYRSFLDC